MRSFTLVAHKCGCIVKTTRKTDKPRMYATRPVMESDVCTTSLRYVFIYNAKEAPLKLTTYILMTVRERFKRQIFRY